MEKITPRQKEILLFVTQTLARDGSTPTVREIARHCGISIGPVQKHLQVLVDRGHLRRKPGLARGLEPVSRVPMIAVPLLGRVRAGAPADPVEDATGHVHIDRSLAGGGDCFALTVRGDSMTGSGIYEDDVVVVRRQSAAEDGETVVALVNGEAAVKRFRRLDGDVWLESTNPAYAPLRGNISIEGKVVYLMRKL